ncbi:MAG: putative porin [Saprospiraceae bacterium]|nr:putative porin [Saprospiraceae bacterium]MDW8484060.1 putative porin [Saprospiraceae bacterium]
MAQVGSTNTVSKKTKKNSTLQLLAQQALLFLVNVLAFCGTLDLKAQVRRDTSGTSSNSDDSTNLYHLYASSPEHLHPDDDTLPDFSFRMYDPARQPQIDWGTLGNLGSSARPLFFFVRPRRGVHTGYSAFDLYYLHADNLAFYPTRRALTDLFVSQGARQNDLMLRVKFSRTFARGVNFSLFHQNIANTGQYAYQAVRHMALSCGVWYPVSPRWNSFFIAARNVSRQQENGGIANPEEVTGGLLGGPIGATIRLPDLQALTRQAHTAFSWINHWMFTSDSLKGKRRLRLSHRTNWSAARFKFSDPGSRPGQPLNEDSTFFGAFLVDRRGIRHYADSRQLENSVELTTFKARNTETLAYLLGVGAQHTFLRWSQEPFTDTSLQNLFLTGRLYLAPSKHFTLKVQSSIGLGFNFGEYQLQGQMKINLGPIGELQAALISQRYPPSLLAHRLGVSQRPFWRNSFEKPIENSLSATYVLPFIGLSVTASAHQIYHYLYFDQRAMPAQTGLPLQIAQLLVSEKLRLGRLRLDLTLAAQRFSREEVIRLPKEFVKAALYHSGYLFQRRLLLEAGLDFRMNSAFRPEAYQPLTAQFHLQDTFTAVAYPWVDLFAAFKVASFRFFFRFENPQLPWTRGRLFFQTAHYAQPIGAIRFGVGWRFLDRTDTEPTASGTSSGRSP